MLRNNPSHEPTTITNTLDITVWREFVDRNPHGNIFHTPEMFQVYSHAKGYRPELRAAVRDSGQVLALLLPVQVTLRDGLLRRLTTRSIAYGSILSTPDALGKEALAALLNDYTQKAGRGGLFTELRHLSDQSVYQSVFARCGFEYQDHVNYLVDLDCSIEELFNRIGPRTRKHIRRGQNKGQVVVDQVNESSRIGEWYELTQKSYSAAHVPFADITLFEAAFEVLHPRNMVKFWIARIGDQCIASSVELIYKGVIYGWYGGVDRVFSSYTPTEMLTWHIMKWAAENGYRTYDFGGAGNPDEEYGVRDFKSKFGGRLVCYGRNTYVPEPWLLKLSTWGYQFYRRVAI
ncbi:MAG: GNAT family N-acetyltransferase [Anaerolineaceae bacterium]|nr:GNAT family N-acetyltransferase [Anaerolineaceae bacterium]